MATRKQHFYIQIEIFWFQKSKSNKIYFQNTSYRRTIECVSRYAKFYCLRFYSITTLDRVPNLFVKFGKLLSHVIMFEPLFRKINAAHFTLQQIYTPDSFLCSMSSSIKVGCLSLLDEIALDEEFVNEDLARHY